MNDDSVYYDPEEFKQKELKPWLEKELESKSARLRALGILDKMDEAASELGVEQIDKVKVAEFMKENSVFDPKDAVSQLYAAESTSTNSQVVGITKDNLAEMVHRSVSSSTGPADDEEDPNYSLETALREKLGV